MGKVTVIKDCENLFKAHRRHFFQLLANEMGIDHWKISAGYGIVQLIIGLSVLSLRPLGIYSILVLLVVSFTGFIWANYIIREKVAQLAESRESMRR